MSELYYLAFLSEDIPDDYMQRQCPPRITMLPRFEIQDTEIAQEIGRHIAKLIPPIAIHLGENAMYGMAKSSLGRSVDDNSDLMTLHFALENHIDQRGGTFQRSVNRGLRYRPHVPLRSKAARKLPDDLVIEHFSLVERPERGQRHVVETFKLTGVLHG